MIADLRDRTRLRHSLNLAMEVQQRLLPARPPSVRGLDVAGHSTYCDETGGDYYDFLVIDQPTCDADRLLIALGDVMGHGIAAALVMAGARAVLRDRAGNAGTLADLMSRLNALLAADLGGTRFMTMHLAVVDAAAGTYRFASAGHDPAIIYDPATGEFTEIDAGDLPLGVMDDTQYEEHSFGPLRPGHVILVGTDGIWEMPSDGGEMFGKDRLRDAIRGSAGGSAADVVRAVLDAVGKFRGDCQPVDDVTFVVVKRVAVASTPSGAAVMEDIDTVGALSSGTNGRGGIAVPG
jgi:sigma-B regulation protein RsbU (phosphoserine phosphatase)